MKERILKKKVDCTKKNWKVNVKTKHAADFINQTSSYFLLRADEIEMVMTDLERANQVRHRAVIFQYKVLLHHEIISQQLLADLMQEAVASCADMTSLLLSKA